MIQIVVADDHHLVRQGIRALLEKDEGVKVIGEAADGQETVDLVAALHPEVVVTDIAMPRLNGTQAIERIKTLGIATRIIVLSMYSDPVLVRQVLKHGAKGYLLKSSVTEELRLAVQAVMRGETYLSPAVSGFVVSEYISSQGAIVPGDIDLLSPREIEVWQLIAEGHTNIAIAQMMNVAVKTVEKHRASLMEKLNIRETAGLVRAAIRNRLVFLDG